MNKQYVWNVFLLVLIGASIGFLTFIDLSPVTTEVMVYIQPATDFRRHFPLLTIILYATAHLITSTFPIPGGCTFLNIFGGALFGFWYAIAIIYPITMASSLIVYAIARFFGTRIWSPKIELSPGLKKKLTENDFLILVTLRLSPLFPFAVLNFLFGLFKLPVMLFVTTTFIGVLLDVALLAGVGASIRASSQGVDSNYVLKAILIFFLVLIAAQYLRSKKVTSKTPHSN